MLSQNTNTPATNVYPIDSRFTSLIEDFKTLSESQIYYLMIGRYKAFRTETRIQFEDYCSRHPLWGSLDDEKEDYTVFDNRAKALNLHWVDFLRLYHSLGDYRSRHILFAFINNWYYFDLNSLNYAREQLFHEYFDMDVLRCDKNEVFVDIGASNGSDVMQYIQTYGMSYKQIYCYETSSDNITELNKKIKKYKNISVWQKAVSDKSAPPGGDFPVETVTIDEDIKEPVTFIKIHTGGNEQKVILGCAGHIKDDKPKLAVAVYHSSEDIWKIPRTIDEICEGYKFYLRYQGKSFYPTNLTLLAVHEGK